MYAADTAHPDTDLADKLSALYALRGGPTIDLTIRPPYIELLKRLGNPHENMPPVIHVAGTNGKGSVIAFLRAILEAAGYKVHTYTSPHLQRFNERIVLAGQEISDETLETLLDEVTAINDDLPQTFFEITTALALTAFARTPADIVLLETGLGGRLDCTNVIDAPLATIITLIGKDHTEYLGDTIAAIAGEKSGIMKQGRPCVIAPQSDPQVLPVLEDRAAQISCALYRYNAEWRIDKDDAQMIFQSGSETHPLPLPALPGHHQIDNAGTALAALHTLKDFSVSPDAMAQGLKAAQWPGRLQKLSHDTLSSGWELWLDGGHNKDAAAALAHQAESWQVQDNKALHLVLGMMTSKNPYDFLEILQPYCQSVTIVPIPGEPSSHTADHLRTLTIDCTYADTVETALQTITNTAPEGRILIAGSLYLAGSVLKTL